MAEILLTIITITRDDPVGLARTLASVQSWRDGAWLEQVVVDGSLVPAKMDDTRIRVVPQVSGGIALAFNAGLAAARGDWVWFLNGGDAVHEGLDPEWLHALLRNTQAGAVTGVLHYDGEEHPHPAPPLRMQWPLLTSWLPHPSTLVRRSVLNDLGGFDSRWKIGMDYDLWYRLLTGSTRVDVVAVPFARFDVTGMSNRPDLRPLLLAENATVIWRHKAVILRTCWQKGRDLAYVFLRAAKNRWF